MNEPEITNVTMHYDAHDSKNHIGYYSFSIKVENVPSSWDYRETIYNNLAKLNAEDLKNIFRLRQIKLKDI